MRLWTLRRSDIREINVCHLATFLPTNHSEPVNERVGLKASSEINFGLVRDLALYALGFVVETAAIYS